MKRCAILALAIIVISCGNKNSVPSDIIRPAQMQNIFWDMIRGNLLAEEMIKKDTSQTTKSAGFALTQKIFAIHNIDSEQFKRSMVFYEKHPALLKVIFDSLSAMQTRNGSLELEKKERFERKIKINKRFSAQQ